MENDEEKCLRTIRIFLFIFLLAVVATCYLYVKRNRTRWCLNSSNPIYQYWRLSEVSKLQKAKDEQSIQKLVETLNDPDNKVRQAVRLALIEHGTASIKPLLERWISARRAFKDEIETVLLCKRREDEIRTLIGFISDDSFFTPVSNVLTKMSEPAIQPLIQYLGNTLEPFPQKRILTLLESFGTQAEKYLLEGMGNNSKEIRMACASVLGSIKSVAAVEKLTRCLDFDRSITSFTYIQALGMIGDPRALDSLEDALSEAVYGQRSDIIRAIGQIPDKRSVEILLALLKTESGEYWLQTCDALIALQSLSCDRLLQSRDDPDGSVRLGVERVLKLMDCPEAKPSTSPDHFDLKMTEDGQENNAVKSEDLDADTGLNFEFLKSLLNDTGSPEATIEDIRKDNILGYLNHRDWQVRAETVYLLGMMTDPCNIAVLLEILRDPHPHVRMEAVSALVSTGDAARSDVLIALDDADPHVRLGAVQILIKTLHNESLPFIRKLARDPCDAIRLEVVNAAKESFNESDLLIEMLDDQNFEVRSLAASGLERIGFRPVSTKSLVSFLLAAQQWNELVSLGEVAIPQLKHALSDVSEDIRKNAIECLSELCNPGKIEPMEIALKDPKPSIRREAIVRMQEICGPLIIDTFLSFLTDPDKDVRWGAAWALNNSGYDPNSIDEKIALYFSYQSWDSLIVECGLSGLIKLMEHVDDPDPEIREVCLEKIFQEDSNLGKRYIFRGLHDPSSVVRAKAAELAYNLPSDDVLPVLKIMLEDHDENVRSMAALSLKSLNYKPTTQAEAIIFHIACKNWDALNIIGETAGEYYQENQWKYREPIPGDILELLNITQVDPILIDFIQCLILKDDKNSFCSHEIVYVIHDQEGRFKYFSTYLTDSVEYDPEVILENYQRLENHMGPNALDLVIRLLDSTDPMIRSRVVELLGKIPHNRSFRPIAWSTGDPSPDVRYAAIQALGACENSRSSRLIRKALNDPDEMVREVALEQLTKSSFSELILLAVEALKDWEVNSVAARTLMTTGWEPSSFKEKIYFEAAMRNGGWLRENWKEVKPILLQEIDKGDFNTIISCVNIITGVGHPDIIPDLILRMWKDNSYPIAWGLSKTRHSILKTESETYLKKFGFCYAEDFWTHMIDWHDFQ